MKGFQDTRITEIGWLGFASVLMLLPNGWTSCSNIYKLNSLILVSNLKYLIKKTLRLNSFRSQRLSCCVFRQAGKDVRQSQKFFMAIWEQMAPLHKQQRAVLTTWTYIVTNQNYLQHFFSKCSNNSVIYIRVTRLYTLQRIVVWWKDWKSGSRLSYIWNKRTSNIDDIKINSIT